MPSVTLITPTRNRPQSFALLERWVYLQTIQPDQWIVVNDGTESYAYSGGQHVVHRAAQPSEGHSLPLNIAAALPLVKTDYVIIAEDDDWWHPRYLERHRQEMEQGYDLIGFKPSRHYHMRSLRWRVFRKDWCNFGSTAFKCETLLRGMQYICDKCAEANSFNLDVCLWRVPGTRQQTLQNYSPHTAKDGAEAYHVGMKGLPGEPGIGMGHKASAGTPDCPSMSTLLTWIGKDAFDRYRSLMNANQSDR